MKVLLGLMAVLLTAVTANAQDVVPDITGVWSPTSGHVITYDGTVLELADMPRGDVVIELQQGPLFRGVYRWHHPEGTMLSDGDVETNMAEETFLGVFAGDGRSFTMADTPDGGYWFGVVLDEDRIELRYVESGSFAAAGYSVMERVR